MMDAWRPYASNFITSFEKTQKEISMTENKPDQNKVVVHETHIGDLIAVEGFVFRIKGLALEYMEPVNRTIQDLPASENRSDDKVAMLIVGSCDEYALAYENGGYRIIPLGPPRT